MINPFDYVKSVYQKNTNIAWLSHNEAWVSLYLNKALVQDPDNTEAINKAIPFSLYISPMHYFYLLYLLVPKKFRFSIKPIKKQEKEEDDVLELKIREYFQWSKKEYNKNIQQIRATILSEREHFEEELGVQRGRKKRK